MEETKTPVGNDGDQGFSDEELAEIMGEIETLEDDFETAAETPDNVVAHQPKASPEATPTGTQSSMDFNVVGDMSLNLNFHVNGQTVGINLNGEQGFTIRLAGGATFTVPLDGANTWGEKKTG